MVKVIKRMQRDPAALKLVLQALSDAGVRIGQQAQAFGVDPSTLRKWRRDAGITVDHSKADLSDGEWAYLPKWEIYVRRDGALANAQSLRLLKPSEANSGRKQVAVNMGGYRTTVTVDRALRAAFGNDAAPRRHHGKLWSEAEERTMRECLSWADAYAAFPDRTRDQIRAKGALMGLHKPRVLAKKTAAINLAVLMRQAMAVVPRYVPSDERDDLVNDLVTMRLEGRREGFDVLLKEARRERNRVMGTWKERSLDAQIGDSNGFTLMDRLDSAGAVW